MGGAGNREQTDPFGTFGPIPSSFHLKPQLNWGMMNLILQRPLQVRTLLHPFESSPMPVPSPKPWLLDDAETAQFHTYSQFRNQLAFVQAHQSPDLRAPCREWNEEMQVCKKGPWVPCELVAFRDVVWILFVVPG